MKEKDLHPTVIEHDLRRESEVDPDLIRRSARGVDLSRSLDRFVENEEIESTDKERLSGILERANWGRVFEDLEEGDQVLTFLTPGPKFLSIKFLNDEVFGESLTNKIIIKRRETVEKLIEGVNKNLEVGQKISPLESNYKLEAMRIPSGSSIDRSVIDEIMQAVDTEMTKFIQNLVSEASRGAHQIPADAKKLDEFKNALEGKAEHSRGKSGFKMNYGLATVDKGSIEGKIGAMAKSLQAGRMARGRRVAEDGQYVYGGEYEQSEFMEELASIAELRRSIISDGNAISDTEGNNFTIFEPGAGEGLWKFNKDLLREIRKEKFQVSPDAQMLLDRIIIYTKKINLVDMLKPFVYANAVAVEEKVTGAHALSELLRDGAEVPETKRQEIAKEVRSDERAEGFTSKIEFDRRAVDMKNAVYISMDVLDLGVDLLLEYETRLQEIENETDANKKDTLLADLSLSVGDKTTERLHSFWDEVKKVLASKKLQGPDNLFTAHVKGDEMVLAVPTGDGDGQIEKNKVGELLFDLKRGTNARIIETRISETEKHTISDQPEEKVKAHLLAIKRSEFGVSILKDVENAARKMTLQLKRGATKEEVLRQIQGVESVFTIDENAKIVEAHVVVVQAGNEFNVVKGAGDSVKYAVLQPKLDSLLGKNRSV